MKGRAKTEGSLYVPGPGAYEPTEVSLGRSEKKRAARVKFALAKRDKGSMSDAPGPGTYHIPCSISNMPDYTQARSKAHAYI